MSHEDQRQDKAPTPHFKAGQLDEGWGERDLGRNLLDVGFIVRVSTDLSIYCHKLGPPHL